MRLRHNPFKPTSYTKVLIVLIRKKTPTSMDTIDIRKLEESPSTLVQADLDQLKGIAIRCWPKTPFPIDKDINNRVVLFSGDVNTLRAEAIVNPTNENLSNLSYVAHMAGPQLEEFVRKKVRLCATGEVRVTPGFASNFSFIIHAVPPKYQLKYKTAAETALFHTYFRILETMIEKRIRTVVMPTLVTSKCNLPLADNCNLQLRIIRRILEKKRHEIDRIVLHIESLDVYSRPFYCYFPRTPLDEEVACYHFEGSLGGANGEPVIPEREIRIKSKPTALVDANDNSIDLTSGLDLSTVVGRTAFSRMREDLDTSPTRGTSEGSCSSGGGGSGGGSFFDAGRRTPGQQGAVQKRSVFTGCSVF